MSHFTVNAALPGAFHDTSPQVCVLTPVYNGAKYLTECIESVLAQTYRNWQYFIVNNRSTDDSLRIAQAYAAGDPRIRVLDCDEHLPAFANFNRMMRLMPPESNYCKVVHADDWLYPNCLEAMVAHAEAHPTAGIIMSYVRLGNSVGWGLPGHPALVNGWEIGRYAYFGGSYIFGTPTSILIRADLVRARHERGFYAEDNLHTDNEACFDMLQTSDFGFVNDVLSYSRKHPETISTFSQRVRSHYMGHLLCLLRYGRVYLNDNEIRRTLTWRMQRYQRYLVLHFHRFFDREFREFHQEQFTKLGFPLQPLRWLLVPIVYILNQLLGCYPRRGRMSRRSFVINLSPTLRRFIEKAGI